MALKDHFRFDVDAAPDWPQRPWLLAGLGALAGLVIHLLTAAGTTGPAVAVRGASVLLVGIAAVLFAFTFERRRAAWGLGFAGGAAALVALVSLVLGGPLAWWDELWRLLSILLAVAIAAPLFQAARDEGRLAFPYAAVHDHVWTNVLLAAAAVSFTGIVFLVLTLLGGLFRLIGIELIWNLVTAPWFIWTLGGGASLGAVGWLRERVGVMRGTIGILALLAPVMGAGLAVFLLSIPFTGLAPLWEATRSTTPILLGCIVGGLVIANSVIGARQDEVPPRAMLWGGIAICASLLPLALIAVVSVAARIDQHGLTPERLWAVVFVAIASAYGFAYMVSLAVGRRHWAERVREANLRLSFGLGATALFLALPILNFNAISARDQLTRLQRGEVTAETFDYAALRFSMGEPGREALARLSASGPREARARATQALRSGDRYAFTQTEARWAADRIRVLPAPVPVPPALLETLGGLGVHGEQALIYTPGATEAILVNNPCDRCGVTAVRFRLRDGAWTNGDDPQPRVRSGEIARGRIEVRPVERRQIFVNGQPIGAAFE